MYLTIHFIHPQISIASVLAGAALLFAILPRWDRFVAPGYPLSEKDEPELFQVIGEVARRTHQSPPKEVFLTPEMNAWVMQRGGICGIGGHRVMGLGLPLLGELTRAEFKAVLAHEFGHYHHGDVKLGPRIYKTRNAMVRTVQTVGEDSLLRAPFVWYCKFSLRTTYGICRKQEIHADILAGRVMGKRVAGEALEKLARHSVSFNAYWICCATAVLKHGICPPIKEGYDTFIDREEARENIEAALQEQLKAVESNPYDTHPTLPERLASIERASTAERETVEEEDESDKAIELIPDWRKLERTSTATYCFGPNARNAGTIEWEEVGERIVILNWKNSIYPFRNFLRTLKFADLSDVYENPFELRFPFAESGEDGSTPNEVPDEVRKEFIIQAVQMALGLALSHAGWKFEALPGQPIRATKGDLEFLPFDEMAELGEKKSSKADWIKRCEDLGILGLSLP